MLHSNHILLQANARYMNGHVNGHQEQNGYHNNATPDLIGRNAI